MTGQTGPRRDEDVLAARYWLTEKGIAATDAIRAAEVQQVNCIQVGHNYSPHPFTDVCMNPVPAVAGEER